nr:PREDICTED: uncharacterized protein LOC109035635 [Bemisia tabaci]
MLGEQALLNISYCLQGSKPTKDSANPNEGLVEDLWTLVFNLEEDEYDVFSNNWIQDDKEIEQGVFNAKYPPENFNANVLAKKGQQYADNWKTVTVKLIEKNYHIMGKFTSSPKTTKLKIKDGTEKRKFFGEFTDEESTIYINAWGENIPNEDLSAKKIKFFNLVLKEYKSTKHLEYN